MVVSGDAGAIGATLSGLASVGTVGYTPMAEVGAHIDLTNGNVFIVPDNTLFVDEGTSDEMPLGAGAYALFAQWSDAQPSEFLGYTVVAVEPINEGYGIIADKAPQPLASYNSGTLDTLTSQGSFVSEPLGSDTGGAAPSDLLTLDVYQFVAGDGIKVAYDLPQVYHEVGSGTVSAFDGTSWMPVLSGVSDYYYAATSDDNYWLVGGTDTSGGIVVHYGPGDSDATASGEPATVLGVSGIIDDLTAVTLADDNGNWIEMLPEAWPTDVFGSIVLIFLTRWYPRVRLRVWRATRIRGSIRLTLRRRCTLTRRALTWVQLSLARYE